jgi:hypothetical protein
MKLTLDKVPTNLDQAVELLAESLDQEDINHILHNTIMVHHFGLDMWLRNNWSLWERDSILVQWFIKNLGIAHADDVSGTILAALLAKVRNEPFDPIEHVKVYKKYWYAAGVDPLQI